MARIRSIHPGLFTDEAFVELSDQAKLLLIGLWGECDDRGVFEWKPIRLKMRLRAWDGAKVEPFLNEMVKLNLIMTFEHEGISYGAVKNFCKWQRPKTPQFLYPTSDSVNVYVRYSDPAELPDRGTALARMLCEQQSGKCHYCTVGITFYRKKSNSLEIDHRIPVSRGGDDAVHNLVAACRPCNSLKSSSTEAEFRAKYTPEELFRRHGYSLSPDAKEPEGDDSGGANGNSHGANGSSQPPIPPKKEMAAQMEDGGDKMKEEKKESSLRSLAARDDFETWWAAYPRKVGKGQAKPAYDRALRKTSADVLLNALKSYTFDTRERFVPHPSTWLNGERWLDEQDRFDPVLRAAGLSPEDFQPIDFPTIGSA